MTTTFPGSIDTLSNPSVSDDLNTNGVIHTDQHANINDGMEAVQTKVGTGASVPVANRVLRGTGSGSSAWGRIVDGDIDPNAEIAVSKLADGAALQFLRTDVAGTGVEWASGNCAFFAWGNGAASNVTGDGTAWGNGTSQVLFPTEIFDSDSCYNPSTGKFTAPVAGNYLFQIKISLSDIAAGHNAVNAYMIRSSTSPTAAGFLLAHGGNMAASGGSMYASGWIVMNLAAGETAYPAITVSGSTKVVDVGSSASFLNDGFFGMKVG